MTCPRTDLGRRKADHGPSSAAMGEAVSYFYVARNYPNETSIKQRRLTIIIVLGARRLLAAPSRPVHD